MQDLYHQPYVADFGYGWVFSGTSLLGPLDPYPKGPCTQIVYTLAPKYLYRDYFEAWTLRVKARAASH